jgi:hypothetical protein
VEEYTVTVHLFNTGVSIKDASATLVDYELGENFENEFNIDSDSLNKIVVHQTIAMSWFTRTGSRPKRTLLGGERVLALISPRDLGASREFSHQIKLFKSRYRSTASLIRGCSPVVAVDRNIEKLVDTPRYCGVP